MKLQVRRGLKADLPTLAAGAFGFCTDTEELYIGSPEGNVLVNTPTGGPMLLSDLTIDADKNWAGKNITNFGAKGYNVGNQLVHGISFNLGLAAVGTKLAQALIPGTFSISTIILYADNAPVGADLILDINKNGSTIFTTQANRPKISDGVNSGESGTPDITSISKADRLSVDIDQVGSTTPGGDDLLVTVII